MCLNVCGGLGVFLVSSIHGVAASSSPPLSPTWVSWATLYLSCGGSAKGWKIAEPLSYLADSLTAHLH